MIDLPNLAFVRGGSATFAAGNLTVTEGSASVVIPLAGDYTGDRFKLSSEGSPAGTLVTLTSGSPGANTGSTPIPFLHDQAPLHDAPTFVLIHHA